MQNVSWVKDLFSRTSAVAPVQDANPAYLKTLSDMASKHGRTKILPAPRFGFNRGK